jgi:hypothetical protein
MLSQLFITWHAIYLVEIVIISSSIFLTIIGQLYCSAGKLLTRTCRSSCQGIPLNFRVKQAEPGLVGSASLQVGTEC